jgi:glycosyltransferase involved in cell wall biosynthesis
LHLLVDAFLRLKQLPGMEAARLEIAGWLGPQHKAYADEQFQKLRAAGHGEAFKYWGEVERAQKLDFLTKIDVLSVPTTYREPKGLFVLEALAAGVPVVQPSHGAFPELLSGTSGGVLVPPHDAEALAQALHALLLDHDQRRTLGQQGRRAVQQSYHATAIAEQTLQELESLVRPRRVPA